MLHFMERAIFLVYYRKKNKTKRQSTQKRAKKTRTMYETSHVIQRVDRKQCISQSSRWKMSEKKINKRDVESLVAVATVENKLIT